MQNKVVPVTGFEPPVNRSREEQYFLVCLRVLASECSFAGLHFCELRSVPLWSMIEFFVSMCLCVCVCVCFPFYTHSKFLPPPFPAWLMYRSEIWWNLFFFVVAWFWFTFLGDWKRLVLASQPDKQTRSSCVRHLRPGQTHIHIGIASTNALCAYLLLISPEGSVLCGVEFCSLAESQN